MRVPCWQLMCGLAATALLGGCAGNSGHASTAPTSAAPTTPTATAVTATATPQPGARTAKWIDLQVGDCVADLPPADLSRITVTIVDCATSHLAEVYLRVPMAVDTAIPTVANRDCAAGLAPYTGHPADGGPYTVTYLIDSNQDRTAANPLPSTVICLLQSTNGQPLSGSARR